MRRFHPRISRSWLCHIRMCPKCPLSAWLVTRMCKHSSHPEIALTKENKSQHWSSGCYFQNHLKIPKLAIFFSVWSLNPHTEVVYIHVVSDVMHRIPALQWEETLATMWAGCFGSPSGSATSNGTLKSSWWDQMGSQWWGGTHRSKCQTSGLTFTNTCTTKKFWIRFQDAV